MAVFETVRFYQFKNMRRQTRGYFSTRVYEKQNSHQDFERYQMAPRRDAVRQKSFAKARLKFCFDKVTRKAYLNPNQTLSVETSITLNLHA